MMVDLYVHLQDRLEFAQCFFNPLGRPDRSGRRAYSLCFASTSYHIKLKFLDVCLPCRIVVYQSNGLQQYLCKDQGLAEYSSLAKVVWPSSLRSMGVLHGIFSFSVKKQSKKELTGMSVGFYKFNIPLWWDFSLQLHILEFLYYIVGSQSGLCFVKFSTLLHSRGAQWL